MSSWWEWTVSSVWDREPRLGWCSDRTRPPPRKRLMPPPPRWLEPDARPISLASPRRLISASSPAEQRTKRSPSTIACSPNCNVSGGAPSPRPYHRHDEPLQDAGGQEAFLLSMGAASGHDRLVTEQAPNVAHVDAALDQVALPLGLVPLEIHDGIVVPNVTTREPRPLPSGDPYDTHPHTERGAPEGAPRRE